MLVSLAELSGDDALEKAGCEKIFQDQVSGAKAERPGLTDAMNYLREGDCLVVWRLDRLGRSLKHLIEVVEGLEEQGTGFISLQEGFDTTTSGGRLVFQIFGALAEFERNLIRERTKAEQPVGRVHPTRRHARARHAREVGDVRPAAD